MFQEMEKAVYTPSLTPFLTTVYKDLSNLYAVVSVGEPQAPSSQQVVPGRGEIQT